MLHTCILIVSLVLAIVGVTNAAKSRKFVLLAMLAMGVFLLTLVHLI